MQILQLFKIWQVRKNIFFKYNSVPWTTLKPFFRRQCVETEVHWCVSAIPTVRNRVRDQEYKVILRSVMSSRPDWATWDPISWACVIYDRKVRTTKNNMCPTIHAAKAIKIKFYMLHFNETYSETTDNIKVKNYLVHVNG